jgi:hypothetical protein
MKIGFLLITSKWPPVLSCGWKPFVACVECVRKEALLK